MDLAYVHGWVGFPAVQIQDMPVKLRVEGVELPYAKGLGCLSHCPDARCVVKSGVLGVLSWGCCP